MMLLSVQHNSANPVFGLNLSLGTTTDEEADLDPSNTDLLERSRCKHPVPNVQAYRQM
jgi:hypothetical protein